MELFCGSHSSHDRAARVFQPALPFGAQCPVHGSMRWRSEMVMRCQPDQKTAYVRVFPP